MSNNSYLDTDLRLDLAPGQEQQIKQAKNAQRKERRSAVISKGRRRLGAAVLLSPLVAGPIIGSVMSYNQGLEHESKIEAAHDNIKTQEHLLVVDQQKLERVEASLGENCTESMGMVTGDGLLAKLPVEEKVTTLLGEAGKPCGETASVVAKNMNSITSASDAVDDQAASVASARDSYIKVKAEDESMPFRIASGLVLGEVAGIAAVAAVGYVFSGPSAPYPAHLSKR